MNCIDINQLDPAADPWYQALFESNPQPMYIYDADTLAFLAVNEAAVRHYGYSRKEFLAMSTRDIRPAGEVPYLLEEIREIRKNHRTGFQMTHIRRHHKKDGTLIDVETSKELLTFNGRQAICVLVNDVTDREQAEKKIQHLAYYDELTDLPNRANLRCRLEDAIRDGQRSSSTFALLVLELVRFREINYTVGHIMGDELLKQVGPRIRSVTGDAVPVARISNVQFGVILPRASAGDVLLMAGRLLTALEEPFPVGEVSFELGAHAGIAFFPGHGLDPGALFRHADIALNQARHAGRDYAIYNAAQDPYKPRRLALLSEFRRAIREGQLKLYCQPKADIHTHEIIGTEALVRWQHPNYGLIQPDQFIPLIEPTELVQPLTRWILEAAIHQCYDWQQAGLSLPMAVNLSTRNLLDAALPDTIGELLQTWGAAPGWIDLEITESGIMADPAASLRVLTQLSQMGFNLFVDDFGTGYSSLSYLMKLPVDAIKIDHSFTMNMIADKDAAAIVKSTIEMAHNLGMSVVAEGTASQDIWNALSRLGCDEAQGQFISHPFPALELPHWLQSTGWKPRPPSPPTASRHPG
jgi:diguanylate cyclase (GGDEF)-like protein/PAS domain S-box-containing protein